MAIPHDGKRRTAEKNINPVTGDRLVTGHATEEYKENFEKIFKEDRSDDYWAKLRRGEYE